MPPQRGRWYISLDYGTVNPTAAGLWCLWKGTAYITGEPEFCPLHRAPGQRLIDEALRHQHHLVQQYPSQCTALDQGKAALIPPMFSKAEHVVDEIPWQALQRGGGYISLD